MQEKGTPEQTPAASEAKTPPKYDATLAKPTASPASQDSCSGIESMGVFQNTVMDAAIGGGVVEVACQNKKQHQCDQDRRV
jgi:hypothetical protein